MWRYWGGNKKRVLALSSSLFSSNGVKWSKLRFIEIFPPGTIFRNSLTAAACALRTFIEQLAACPCIESICHASWWHMHVLENKFACQHGRPSKDSCPPGFVLWVSHRVMDSRRINTDSAITSTIAHVTEARWLIECGPVCDLIAKSFKHGFGVFCEDRYNGFAIESSKTLLQSLQWNEVIKRWAWEYSLV